MELNQGNKKLSSRRKKTENEKLGIHALPHEIVEIERNLIENWLISIKHWFQINPSTARKIILGIFAASAIFFIGVFIHSAVIEKHNSDFYSILLSYEKFKGDGAKIEDSKLKKMLEYSDKLCNTRWSTRYSNNGCYLSAILYNESGDKKSAAKYLEKFSDKVNNKAVAAYAAFISGYFYETEKDLDNALLRYKKMEKTLDNKHGMDFSLYHTGRVFYYKNQFTEAENAFKKIIKDHKDSSYSKQAREYLMLIYLKKSATDKGK